MRALLVLNARCDEAIKDAIRAGVSPRKDFLELRRELDADLIDVTAVESSTWSRFAGRLLGVSAAQGLLAWVRSRHYDVVFADREPTGFILAALLRLQRRRPRLVIIGHFLSPPKKQLLFRALRLHRALDCIIVHSSLQREVAERDLRLPAQCVALIPYHSDVNFWLPMSVPQRRQICSAGLEFRDHGTLMNAVRDLDVAVIIGAASHWSKHRTIGSASIPANVRISSFDYKALRQVYAESLFVVVPLQDVDNQAGITTILEAMSMGKAVVVSHSRGQVDVVRDRRRLNRTDPERATQSDWMRQLGAADGAAQGQTGIYVMPGDASELRRVIQFLLDHPERAAEMGANGRRVMETAMSLDHYVQRVADIIRGETSRAGMSAGARSTADPVPGKA